MEKLELDTKGKKAELVERLQAHIDEVKNNSQADEAKVEEDSKDAEEVAETAEEPEKVDEPEKSEKSDAGEGIEVNADEENEKMEDDKVEEEVRGVWKNNLMFNRGSTGVQQGLNRVSTGIQTCFYVVLAIFMTFFAKPPCFLPENLFFDSFSPKNPVFPNSPHPKKSNPTRTPRSKNSRQK